MIRYGLTLKITYKFDRPSGAGRQLLRVRPQSIPGVQLVNSCRLTTQPKAIELRSFTDFFGTTVDEVVLPAGLDDLVIEMRAEVIRRGKEAAAADLSTHRDQLAVDLAALHDLGPQSPHHFLFPTEQIPPVPAIAAYAAKAVEGTQTVRQAVQALGEALHNDLSFDAKATTVDTPIIESFEKRHGVCQDFSQIMISGLRSLGIPAAYVSGFLRTLPPPGKPRLQGADAMHAWVRAWCGVEQGWIEYDPTNSCFVTTDHVVIGYGRDYADAAPVTGMLRINGTQRTGHSVDIIEL